MLPVWLAVLACAAPLTATSSAGPRAPSGDDAAILAFLGAALVSGALSFDAPPRRWEGPVLFDAPLRSALRADSDGGRVLASQVSDVLQAALAAWPVGGEALLGAGVRRGDWALAGRLLLMDTTAYLFAGTATLFSKNLAGRQRPYVADCAGGRCGGATRNKSFISGHAATSFTAAGLTCAAAHELDPYELGAARTLPCWGALGLAAVVSTLRVVSDEHYASDVLAGALVGLLAGYLLPRLLYLSLPLLD